MSTAKVTANTAAQTLFVSPAVKKAIIDSVNIDNQSGGAETVTLLDNFTPTASVGNASPSAQHLTRRVWEVGNGLTADIPKRELEGLEMYGTVTATGSVISASCNIIVSYHFAN